MAAQKLQKLVIVGASSKIAAPTVTHLLEKNPDLDITILSRAVSRANFPESPRITVKKGDYDDEEFLAEAFKGQEAVMIVISIFAMEAQYKLIDAAAKAGVKWILPNEYGADNANPNFIKLHRDLTTPKDDVLRYIEKLSGTYPGLKYIAVATGPWLDTSINAGLFGISIRSRTYTRFPDAGYFSTTTKDQVGQGLAALLSLPINSTPESAGLDTWANKFAYVASHRLNQDDLFAAIKRFSKTTDDEWTIKEWTIAEREAKARKKLESGDIMGGADLAYCNYIGEGRGGDFEHKAAPDRKLLGLQPGNLDEDVAAALAHVDLSCATQDKLPALAETYEAIEPKKYAGKLDGKVALVTGASSGIGRSIAKGFAAAGASVAVVARREPELVSLVEEVSKQGQGRAVPFVADVAAEGAAKDIVARVGKELGPVDILINNAGINHIGLLSEEEPDAWWKVQQVNVFAPVALSCAVLPSMLKRKTGVIISTSSSSAATAAPALSASSTSKATLSKFHECLARELDFLDQSQNIVTFAVNPGVVMTEQLTSGFHHPLMQKLMSDGGFTGEIKMQTPELCADTMVALAADSAYKPLTGRHLNAAQRLPRVLEEVQKKGQGRIGAENLYLVNIATM
ncbi:hypothetical protein PRZ48_012142 [Zasmidium cellare]|uniref:NmrA-like domain-containing protein n=1 Tax=Zasmidium cellare TaxID=395010 RepID=A0ABR0E429_ZASCE|nr:hypothetical protein PRZ48_012142 [Zasmidium cellare]